MRGLAMGIGFGLASCGAADDPAKSPAATSILMLECIGHYDTTESAPRPESRTYRIDLERQTIESLMPHNMTWQTVGRGQWTATDAAIGMGEASTNGGGQTEQRSILFDRISGRVEQSFMVSSPGGRPVGFGFSGDCKRVERPAQGAKF